jgi:cytochrome c peroxidase
MKFFSYFHLFVFALTLSFSSCKVDPKIKPAIPADNLREIRPEGWPQPIYSFSVNTISEDKFVLGRALFYERMLSEDNTVSCGSCHQDFGAFSNPGHDLSHGIHDRVGTRNSPGIFNMTWHPSFMHDGGINHIEVQPLGPITNTLEMGGDLNAVIAKLQSSARYRELFNKAYGDEEVTSQRLFRSMAQFMALMYSYNSKFDRYKRNEGGVQLTESESRGYSLFQSKCNSCHKEPLFSDFQFRNNGLSPKPFVNDSGRWMITHQPQDIYKFKTPSLRNIEKTPPYMHDGRFETLEQCLDHYTGGITNMLNLDPQLQSGIALSAQEKQDIIAFLRTLTDFTFINDKRFADPNFQ